MSTKGELVREIQIALRELTGRLHQLNDAVGDRIGLLAGDIELLDHIGRRGPASPSGLSETFGIHPATLTGILDRLERGGWVTRSPDPADRRKVEVTARFDRAEELLRLFGPMNRSIARLGGDLALTELSAIRDFLSNLVLEAKEATIQLREA